MRQARMGLFLEGDEFTDGREVNKEGILQFLKPAFVGEIVVVHDFVAAFWATNAYSYKGLTFVKICCWLPHTDLFL